MSLSHVAYAVAAVLFVIAACWPGPGTSIARVGLAALAIGLFLS